MPEKKKTRSWKGSQTIVAVIAMLTQLALCNIFAGVDRVRIAKKTNPTELQSPTPTLIAQPAPAGICPTSIPERNMGAKCIARTRSS